LFAAGAGASIAARCGSTRSTPNARGDRLVPLPDVTALVEGPIRAVGVLVIADLRTAVGAVDGVDVSLEGRVIARIGRITQDVARPSVAACRVVEVVPGHAVVSVVSPRSLGISIAKHRPGFQPNCTLDCRDYSYLRPHLCPFRGQCPVITLIIRGRRTSTGGPAGGHALLLYA
jgi:hypothetical protein